MPFDKSIGNRLTAERVLLQGYEPEATQMITEKAQST